MPPAIGSFVLLIGSFAASALAQVPGQLLPGPIERQFQQLPEPRAQPGAIQIPVPSQQAPANADAIKFTLTGVTIEGATVYPEAALLPYYEKHLNREVSLADVYSVAGAITARYRNDGYILSQVLVPAQTVDGGRVRLQAVEGYVAEVIIGGAADAPLELVSAYADKIKSARPLTAQVLERYVLLMNDLPGAFARTTLTPSKTQQGASDLLVEFTQRRVTGGFSMDNRGSAALGPLLWSGDLAVNAVFWVGDRTSARIVSTFDDELHYLSVSHDEQIGSEGARIGLTVNFVRSNPDTSAGFVPLFLRNDSNSGSVNYVYPVLRSRSENLYLRAGFTAYNGSQKLFGVSEVSDRVRAVRLGFTYDVADRYGGVNIIDVELGHGLNAFGASNSGDPGLSRINGKPDFTKVALYAARLQSLVPKWTLLTAVTAQYAGTDLLAPELFCYGGEQFGRAFDPCVFAGDSGAAVKQELRYTDVFQERFEYTAYGFYDVGWVQQRTPAALKASESGASVGLGLRFTFDVHFSGFVELAKPITNASELVSDRDLRVYAGFAMRF
jgi:hemolysin activation/secretion protein